MQIGALESTDTGPGSQTPPLFRQEDCCCLMIIAPPALAGLHKYFQLNGSGSRPT